MKKIILITFLFLFLLQRAQVYNGSIGNILNNGTPTSFNLSVSGLIPASIDSTFGIQEVRININHPKVEQLYIYLRSPAGTIVEVSDGTMCQGANYLNACFNNTANTSITTGLAPYSGTFLPVGYLGRFNTSQAGNGLWTLIVKDYLAFVDSGNVLSWSIKFGNTPPHPVVFKSSNLPIVNINTNNQVISDNKILVNMGIIYNGVGQINNVTDPMNHYNAKAEIHLRGNSTKYFEKKPYSLETHDLAGAQLTASLLGMPAESDWVLVASYQDKSLLRIPLAYNLSRKMGHYSPRFVNVELIINGEYQGVYALMEKIKRDKNRVDISQLTTSDNTAPSISGGYIITIDRADSPGWPSLLPGNAANNKHFFYQYSYPKDSDITVPQKNYIKSVLDTFETVMSSPSYSDPVNGYAKRIAVNSFVDYFIINELSKNIDAYRLSTFMYKESTAHGGKLHIGPVWDYDIAWHNCNYGNAFLASDWQYQAQDTSNPIPKWWNRFMQDSNFVNNLSCRWKTLRQNILSLNSLNAYIDSSTTALTEARKRNFIQWPTIGAYIWPNPQSQVNATYQGEVNDLKTWLTNRITWMDGAIAGQCKTVGIKENTNDIENSVLVYPNPFESTTTFSLRLINDATVNLIIMDQMGRVVSTLIDEPKLHQGESKIIFNRNQLSPGIYFYRLKINNISRAGKIIIQ